MDRRVLRERPIVSRVRHAVGGRAELPGGGNAPRPEIPSWGTMMADGRSYLSSATWIIMFPGLFLAATFLSVNIVGDGLRDLLDPRFAKEV